MTKYEANTHPAIDTNNYVPATIKVPDKYGILDIASKLLVSMYQADRSAGERDETEAVNTDVDVQANWADFMLQVEDLAKDMGGELNRSVDEWATAYGYDENEHKTLVEKKQPIEVNDPYDLVDLTFALLEEQEDKTLKAQELMTAILNYTVDLANAEEE